MCFWKITARCIDDLGGSATLRQIQLTSTSNIGSGAICELRRLKMLTSNRRMTGCVYRHGQRVETIYTLTERGRLWCQGKLTDVRGQGTARTKKSLGFVATWLRVFPEAVRIVPPPGTPEYPDW